MKNLIKFVGKNLFAGLIFVVGVVFTGVLIAYSATQLSNVEKGETLTAGTLNGIIDKVYEIESNTVPSGTIVMWAGTIDSIPEGWQLADGTNGSPDLRDKFIYGVSEGEEPGLTGGSTKHQHGSPSPTVGGEGSSGMSTIHEGSWPYGTRHVSSFTAERDEVNSKSSGLTEVRQTTLDNHLPPYYKLAFIIKQ